MKVLIIILGLFSLLWSKEVCLSCHTDSAHTSIFTNSAHAQKQVTCSDCHVAKENGLKTLWKKCLNFFTFSYKNAHLADLPRTRTCLSCHSAITNFNIIAADALPDSLKDIGMVINHKGHYERRDSCNTCHYQGQYPQNQILDLISGNDPGGCVFCHQGLVHMKPKKYASHSPLETTCAHCHSEKKKCPGLEKCVDVKDSDQCTTCHPNQYSF